MKPPKAFDSALSTGRAAGNLHSHAWVAVDEVTWRDYFHGDCIVEANWATFQDKDFH